MDTDRGEYTRTRLSLKGCGTFAGQHVRRVVQLPTKETTPGAPNILRLRLIFLRVRARFSSSAHLFELAARLGLEGA
jgi:hypothetical protein